MIGDKSSGPAKGTARRTGNNTGSVARKTKRMICPNGPLGLAGNQELMTRIMMSKTYKLTSWQSSSLIISGVDSLTARDANSGRFNQKCAW